MASKINTRTIRSSDWLAPAMAGAVLLTAVLTTCVRGPAMPAVDGAVIEIRRSGRSSAAGEAGFEDTLQLYWFGSSCHVIQLGELSVLTDPFVTNGFSIANLTSSPERVGETFGRIAPPTLVLVNHSHFDHLLDAHAALSLPAWKAAEVPLHGGRTTANLLAGWQDREVMGRTKIIPRKGGEIVNRKVPGGYRLRIEALPSLHSPHLSSGKTFADGYVTEPRATPPSSITDFQAGETYNFLVELHGPTASFTVFFLAAPYDLEVLPHSLPRSGVPIDVAIVSAPGSRHVKDFPTAHLARLRPRHVVLSHFNTFLKEEPDEQLSILGRELVDMRALSRQVQETFAGPAADYPEFERLHIPAITRIPSDRRARNVIRIEK